MYKGGDWEISFPPFFWEHPKYSEDLNKQGSPKKSDYS